MTIVSDTPPVAERIVLDPAEETTGRTELDITPWVGKDGVDWGDAQVEQHQADADRGQVPVGHRVPNREISVPLALKASIDTGFGTARAQLQAKVALWQSEGGVLKRVLADGAVGFVDITSATLKLSGGWHQAHRDLDVEAVLSMQAIPDFYSAETSRTAQTGSGALTWTEAAVLGDWPGRCRIEVTPDGGADHRALVWAVRSRHYDPAAPLSYQAEALTVQDAATVVAATGASGGQAVKHPNLGGGWTPVLATGPRTHRGTYRVLARVWSDNGAAVDVRFVADVGDLARPAEGPGWTFPAGSGWYLADLGSIRLDAAPAGVHRWYGQLQARGAAGGETVVVDTIDLVPTDEGWGVLRATPTLERGLAAPVARDEFNQTAGNLSGKTAPVGGVWAGIGDANDFYVNNGFMSRLDVGDDVGGRTVTLPISATNVAVAADMAAYAVFPSGLSYSGVVARYGSATQMVFATINILQKRVELWKASGGAAALTAGPFTADVALGVANRLTLTVSATGTWQIWLAPVGGADILVASGVDTDLATGGALAAGAVGIRDERLGGLGEYSLRTYDNFAAWVPAFDPVAFAGQPVEVTTQGAWRADTTGVAYGPVADVRGDLPRLPAAGLEGRPVQIYVRGSRGDLDQFPDTTIDSVTARVHARASWLTVPS